MLSPRIKADLDVFESDGRLTIAASAVDKTLELADFKKSLDAEESSLGSKIDALLPWETYGENVNCSGTESTTLMLGSFPLAIDLDTVNDAVDSEGLLTTMQPISLDSSRQYVRVIAYNSATESTLKLLTTFGIVGVAYFIMRIVGKYLGAYLGCLFVKSEDNLRKYLGAALVPQAGVAIGLAYLSQRILPTEVGSLLMTIILSSSVLYELIGPACAKFALIKSGAIPQENLEKQPAPGLMGKHQAIYKN